MTIEAVKMNVGRMLDRYVSTASSLDNVRGQLATGGRLVAEEFARAATEKGGDYARAFFEEFGFWSEDSPRFAEHARFLFSSGDDDGVIRVLSRVPGDSEPLAVGLPKAEAQLRLGRDGDAVATLLPWTPEKWIWKTWHPR